MVVVTVVVAVKVIVESQSRGLRDLVLDLFTSFSLVVWQKNF